MVLWPETAQETPAMLSTSSAQAKLDRARAQCDTLCSELAALSDRASYGFDKRVDTTNGEEVYYFADVPSLPPDLALRIGEMLYNYRCSLDHLVWQLVLSAGKTPGTNNEFPIFNDITKYASGKVRRLDGVPPAAISIIDGFQPCSCALVHEPGWHLWYLHELNNVDKHRQLVVTRRILGPKLRLSYVTRAGNSPVSVPARYYAAPVEDGAEFARVKPTLGAENLEVHPRILVLFDDPPSPLMNDVPVDHVISLIDTAVATVFAKLRGFIP